MNNVSAERVLLDLPEGVLCIEGGTITFANAAVRSILGKEPAEVIGQPFVQAFCEYEENDDFNKVILDAVYDENVSHEKAVLFFDGIKMHSLHIKISFIKDAGQTQSVVVVFDDISDILNLRDGLMSIEEVQALNAQLEARDQMLGLSRAQYKTEMETDLVTGLYNRDAAECIIFANLEQMLPDELTALYFLDIDNFKEINDAYGGDFGDMVLKDFAVRLKKLFRSGDCVGRFANDEFMVLMTSFTDRNIIAKKAAQMVELAKKVSIENTNIAITVSVGAAVAPTDGDTYELLSQKAIAALNKAKAKGGDGFFINES